MKTLQKLRLINWHYFLNSKIDFGMINFLTGENAAGKSTLIDAMQVVLLGDTTGRSFNKAANEKSGRTLKSYLRGEIGDNDDGSTKYLRSGRFTSYIAMEFYDDIAAKSFTIGIVFDTFDDGSEEHKFFYLKSKFPENDFCALNVPLSIKDLSEYIKQNYSQGEFALCDSNVQYQNLLKEKFGNLKDKYFSLFKKAVSFTPITNIEQFITDYVCDVPQEINIESMKANIASYERLKLEADDMKIKIASLEEIHNLFADIQAKKDEQKLSAYISKRITYQLTLDRINELQESLKDNALRSQEIDQEIAEIDTKLKQYNDEKEKLIGLRYTNDTYKINESLKKSRDEASANIENIKAELTTLYTSLNGSLSSFSNNALKTQTILEEVANLKLDDELLETSKNLKEISSSLVNKISGVKNSLIDKNLTNEQFRAFANNLNEFKSQIVENIGLYKRALTSYVTSLNNHRNSLNNHSNGKLYDYNFLQVKTQLEHALKDYFHEDVKVSIFADLIDIKSPTWVKAIEGFIFPQKLNLFVEDKYYEKANLLLPELQRKNKFYRTGLVDSRKLIERGFNAEAGSVAEEIVTDHVGARAYANFLLGNIYKCSTFAEARESGRGLLPNCTGYRNFASFTIPEGNYSYSLIGRTSSSINKQAREETINNEERIVNVLNALMETFNFISRSDTMSQDEISIKAKTIEKGEALPSLIKNLEGYEQELANTTSSQIQINEGKIAKINENIAILQSQRDDLMGEKGSLKQSSDDISNEKIPTIASQSGKIIDEIKATFDEKWVNDTALVIYQQEVDNAPLADVRIKYDQIFTTSQVKIRSIVSAFNELRKDYIIKYKMSYDITREDNDDFEKELVLLRDEKLPEYTIKIEDAKNKATKEFKDDFIFKLKTSIEQARNQIDELNEALKDAKFGQDTYEFTVQPNPQYIDYYNMITDELLLEYGSDENAFLEKHQDIMDNLFRMIGEDNNSSAISQNIEKFTDYRTYLLFDLKVLKPNNQVYSLARNIKKASGGETQTPFYISILASFSQLYRVKQSSNISNCSRLVVFDEAFSKMDRNRIVEAIKILKQFELQVILSAPPEKINDISKIVDETLIVTRRNNRSYIDKYLVKKEE